MPICEDRDGNIFEEFIDIAEESVKKTQLEYPLTHALNGRPFMENEEAKNIVFWDGKEDIGYITEIDRKLLGYWK